jgi:hypothetical protein
MIAPSVLNVLFILLVSRYELYFAFHMYRGRNLKVMNWQLNSLFKDHSDCARRRPAKIPLPEVQTTRASTRFDASKNREVLEFSCEAHIVLHQVLICGYRSSGSVVSRASYSWNNIRCNASFSSK